MTSNLVNSLLVQRELELDSSRLKENGQSSSLSVSLKVSVPTIMRLDKLLSCIKDIWTDDPGVPL